MGVLSAWWKPLRDSFRFRQSFLFVLAYEVLFVLGLAVLSSVFLRALGVIAESIRGITPQSNLEVVSQMKFFFVNSVLAALLFFVAVFVLYALVQMLTWSRVLGRPVTARFLAWSVWANSVWLLPWACFAWLLVVGVRGEFAAPALFVLGGLFVHVSWRYQRALFQHGIKVSVGVAFSESFGKLASFLVPYLVALVLLWVWGQVWSMVVFGMERAGWLVIAPTPFLLVLLGCVVFAPYFAWLKLYLAKISV